MRFFLAALLIGLLVVCATAVAPQKSVIFTYPSETPDHVIDEAMSAIQEAVR